MVNHIFLHARPNGRNTRAAQPAIRPPRVARKPDHRPQQHSGRSALCRVVLTVAAREGSS